MKMKIKVNDMVRIIAGKDKNKEGKVLKVDHKNRKVLVEGYGKVTKHSKPNAMNRQGGIIHQEAFIDVSNVVYLHNGQPTKLGVKVVQEEVGGKMKNVRYRVAKSTGDVIEDKRR
ncbi:MAG: 50S ribosomal protein L24 [Eubacteriales bacterium]|nr:50S ribosomal protein L24 [Eubacteriales bacterium]